MLVWRLGGSSASEPAVFSFNSWCVHPLYAQQIPNKLIEIQQTHFRQYLFQSFIFKRTRIGARFAGPGDLLWSRPYCRATVLPRDDARSTHKTRVYVIIPMAWFQSGFRRDEAIKPACAPIAWSILIALLPHPSSYRHTPLHLNFAIRMFQILSRKLAIC